MGEIEMSEIKVPQENIIYAWDNVEEIKACLEFIDIEKDENSDLLKEIDSYATSAMAWLAEYFTAEDRTKLFEESK